MTVHPDELVEARLTRSGHRYTRGRRDLVAILCAAAGPLTVDDLRRRGARLSKSSLYRNLAVLTDAGVVREVVAADGLLRFELCEPIAGHHHHLVCTRCGAVVDYPPSTALEAAVDATRTAVTTTTGFVTTSHRIDLEGLCAHCARASPARTAKDEGVIGAHRSTGPRSISLGPVEETLLIPLYGRAQLTREGSPLISDQKAVEIVEAIDYDFAKFRRAAEPARLGRTNPDLRPLGRRVARRASRGHGRRGGRGAQHSVRARGQRRGPVDRPRPS